MTGTHLEVETKYDAPASLQLPALDTAAPVARVGAPKEWTLEAVYYDTDDLRLAARRITLRRRTGGHDAGWHLKLPASDGGRHELGHPLDESRGAADAPPERLLRAVRAYVRAAELRPVARVKTRRTAYHLYDAEERVLAEVADDTVTGERFGPEALVTSWRELEVELVDGERTLLDQLDEVLRAAGAVPSAAGSKLIHVLGDRVSPAAAPAASRKAAAGEHVMRYVRAQVDALLAADAGVRDDVPDAVHKMRVATRRLRSSLATYRRLFDPRRTEPVRAELKWLGVVLGEVRDVEVMRAHVRETLDALPPELVLGPVVARAESDFVGRLGSARERLLAELDGERYFRLLDELDALLSAPPFTARAARPAARELRRQVGRDWRRLRAARRQSKVAVGERRDIALHETRKAAKRARYAAEAAAPVVGRRAERFVVVLTGVQQALGTRQDSVVLRPVLRTMGAQAHLAGENGFTFGLLHGLEHERAEAAEQAYRAAWREAARKRHRKWFR